MAQGSDKYDKSTPREQGDREHAWKGTWDRPLSVDELLEFELPDRGRVNGRARVLREQAYRIYALRFEKLGDEARSEIAELTQPRDRTT